MRPSDERNVRRLWIIWIVVAIGLTTTYFVLPTTPESKLVLYNGVGLLSILALLAGIRRNQAEPREPWLWFAAGLMSFLTADVIYYLLELVHPEGPPFPNVADFFYLMMYPLMIVGLTKMVRAVSPGRDTASFIDAAVVAIAMFGTLWVLFVDTVWSTEANSTEALLVSLAYPVMDVALFAVAARLVVSVHLRHPPFAFILLALASLAIADTGYGIFLANGTFRTGLFIDAFWLTFYVGFGAAALHPAMSTPAPKLQTQEGKLSGRQLVIMFVATLSVPMIDLIWGTQEDRVVTIICSAFLFLLILVRVFGLMQALQRGQDRLRYDAEHDSLTGLSNRSLFAERTRQALDEAATGNVAVLFIDLDDFKTVNDSLGHEAGDRLLAEVGERLSECVGDEDTIARFGGDEFAVLLGSVDDKREVMTFARRVLDKLAEPVDLGTRSVQALASIGIAIDEPSNADVESLLRNADVAMYLSKSRGKGRFEFFQPEMHEEAIERLDLKADLKRAVEEEQFVLHYQPIFEFESGRPLLVESLVRWRHPERGLISPDRFVNLAEESGLIVELGSWVLREACMQAKRWQSIEGLEDLGVTVNLSMRQLQDTQLVNILTRALQDSGLQAEHLVLEITESMLALDAETSAGVLGQLKTIGVKLAIDDFGTGYSSLSYLRSFPVDSIKIDRSFINELHRSSTSTALIEAVVNLSQALGAYTVAEGIEHSDQASQLRKLGCDRGQGFYYCRPLPAAALTSLFREHISAETEPLEAWRRSSERVVAQAYHTEIRRDLAELRAIDGEITELNRDLNIPVMGAWPWLANWAESFSNWTPLMVGVRSAATNQLMAAAFFATLERAEGNAIVAMGHGSSLFTALQARDSDSAAALASAVAEVLSNLPGAWSLDLEQIQDMDPALQFLADELDHAQLLPELRIPRVVFSTAHTVDDILSKSKRKQLRRASRRIEEAGLDMNIAFDRGRAITTDLIDEVEEVHVSRDRDSRRNSDLDRPAEREFWRRVVEAANNDWEIEIASLRLNGRLAAYVVAILDGDVYRVYDGRMSTEFQDFSPGRLVEAAALSRALSDPRFAVLDWMSGIAAEKLLATNMSEGRARLVATSGSRFIPTPRDEMALASRR